ncbi:MAG TPA: phage tail protein [Amaricoccus sp.]|uniref:phage tail protein n=1 Tax=Amaricoccus sp. TaxID=1872485 RepID=UPI002CD81E4E|nr:phage tail protein [Amaricoccus sp.]HMR51179.1 phage tail protein [Amaricoccus sp.]HMT98073.1 phage tail protein [Amaricoccus sp.]
MPQVGAGIAAVLVGSTAAPLAGTGLLAGLYGTSALVAVGGLALKAFTQIAIGTGLSVLGQALQKRPEQRLQTGVRVSETVGEDVPATIILGRDATRGHRVYIGSQGETGDAPNSFLTEVLEISDFPATLRRVMVNGEWVRLSAVSDPTYGPQVVEYRSTKKDNYYLWIKYFDGTQTAAAPALLAMFPGGERPWTSDMVGRGIPYAVVTARTNPEIHRGKPECVFEVDGTPLYDPRRDTTVGGAGAHRLDDQSTWEQTDNPVVMIYNILLGLRDPVTDETVFGGGVGQFQLPLSVWAAAMNACDADATGEMSDEPAYRAGIEIPLSDSYTPADAIGELLTACQGRIAEVCGQWLIAVGAPPPAVYAFTDDDVIVTEPDELDPFPGLDETFNGVASSYPEPEDGWQPRSGPARISAAWLAADGGRQNVASVQYPTVWARAQVQRLDKAALADHRRMRRHTLVLPPDCRVGPLDVVEWTSARNGYADKAFFVDLVEEDQASGCVALALREVDPNDYDFGEGDLLPTSVGYTGRLPVLPLPIPFSVEAAYVTDAAGGQRRAAIRMNWDPDVSEVNGVRYVIRVAAQPEHEPLAGGADFSDDDLTLTELEEYPGVPLYQYPGEPLVSSVYSEVERGTMIVADGILPATAYEVRMRYRRPGKDGPWSGWMDVTTFDLRIGDEDLTTAVREKIEDARAQAAAAAALADEAMALATAAADATGTAGRLVAGGWVEDPGFNAWTGDDPDNWTVGNYPSEVSFTAGGFYDDSAAEMDCAASATGTYLRAGHLAGQMNAAVVLAQEYVVVSLMLEYLSGDLGSGRCRARWQVASGYVTGEFPMHSTPTGDLDELGLRPQVTTRQLVQFVQKKPAGTATDIRLEFYAGINAALHVIVHALDVRAATAAEIDAINLRNEVAASLDALNLTIAGINTALSADITSLAATVGANTAAITDQAVAMATADGALSQRLITVEAGRDGANLVRNGAFLDGERLPGDAPDFWSDWPASWRVATLGDTALGSTLAWCPGKYAVRMPLDASLQEATVTGAGPMGDQFQAAGGDSFHVKFRYSVSGGSRDATIRVFLTFYDAADGVITSAPVGVVSTGDASNPWPTFEASDIIAPAGTAYVKIRMRRGGGGAGVAFFTALEVRKTDPTINGRLQSVIALKAVAGEPAALELVSVKDGNLDASVARLKGKTIILDGDVLMTSAFVEELLVTALTAQTAWIVNANIENLTLAGEKLEPNAVSDLGYDALSSSLTVTNDDQWYTLASVTIPRVAGVPVLLFPNWNQSRESNWNLGGISTKLAADHDYRILRDGTQVEARPFPGRAYVDFGGAAGNRTYYLQVLTRDPVSVEIGGLTYGTTTRNQSAIYDEGSLIAHQIKK